MRKFLIYILTIVLTIVVVTPAYSLLDDIGYRRHNSRRDNNYNNRRDDDNRRFRDDNYDSRRDDNYDSRRDDDNRRRSREHNAVWWFPFGLLFK
jgi:hypothetical protein